ncbi:MAG: hypothetical protein ACJA1U_000274 [Bermanella sp.]|jgi:uncharacterized protein (DUF2164 family)
MIELDTQKKSILVDKIKTYFDQELHQDIGQFDAEFLLDFFAKEVGVFFYNKGVEDAKHVIDAQFQAIDMALMDIEQPESL